MEKPTKDSLKKEFVDKHPKVLEALGKVEAARKAMAEAVVPAPGQFSGPIAWVQQCIESYRELERSVAEAELQHRTARAKIELFFEESCGEYLTRCGY